MKYLQDDLKDAEGFPVRPFDVVFNDDDPNQLFFVYAISCSFIFDQNMEQHSISRIHHAGIKDSIDYIRHYLDVLSKSEIVRTSIYNNSDMDWLERQGVYFRQAIWALRQHIDETS